MTRSSGNSSETSAQIFCLFSSVNCFTSLPPRELRGAPYAVADPNGYFRRSSISSRYRFRRRNPSRNVGQPVTTLNAPHTRM